MTTYMAKKGQVPTGWYLVDIDDKVLGRAAVKIATILMGKHRPQYTPHVDTGEFVVVINADKVRLTGRKLSQKTHQRYSGYPGGHKVIPLATVLRQHPERVIIEAVRRMLPKNKLAASMLKKLKVYAGPEHPHLAQSPKPLEI